MFLCSFLRAWLVLNPPAVSRLLTGTVNSGGKQPRELSAARWSAHYWCELQHWTVTHRWSLFSPTSPSRVLFLWTSTSSNLLPRCNHLNVTGPDWSDWKVWVSSSKGGKAAKRQSLRVCLCAGSRQRTSEINVANCAAGSLWNDDITIIRVRREIRALLKCQPTNKTKLKKLL